MDSNLLSAIIEAISNVGFPIFIALYLLHRVESKMDHMIQALNNLTQVLANRG